MNGSETVSDSAIGGVLRSLAGLAGAAWALLLLPPVLVAWDGAGAPGWAIRVSEDAGIYDAVRQFGRAVGLGDPYVLFGLGASISFALIGYSLLGTRAAAGSGNRTGVGQPEPGSAGGAVGAGERSVFSVTDSVSRSPNAVGERGSTRGAMVQRVVLGLVPA